MREYFVQIVPGVSEIFIFCTKRSKNKIKQEGKRCGESESSHPTHRVPVSRKKKEDWIQNRKKEC